MLISNLAQFAGTLKAYASTDNPLQTVLELVITPFGANKNNQRIPRTEAGNILRTCIHQPIKIDLQPGNVLGGHKNSVPVGTITYAEETDDCIIGKGIVWEEEFPEVTDFLKKRTAENNPVGTSWEILFEKSAIAEDGVEELFNTYYAANTIVANPSYGNLTLIRAVAEDLGIELERNMAENTNDVNSTEAESLEEERKTISDLQQTLGALYGRLDELWFATFEIEEAEATKTENVEDFSTRLNDLVSQLTERANTAGVALAEKQTTIQDLETKLAEIQSELDTLKAEKAQAELDAKVAKRESALAEIGISLEENKDVILDMSDTAFDLFVSSIKVVRSSIAGNKSTAEVKINLPDPVGSTEITTEDIVNAHKEATKKGK